MAAFVLGDVTKAEAVRLLRGSGKTLQEIAAFAPCVIRSPQRCMTGRVARPVGDFRDRIVVNPAIRSGKPVIRGTRITVSDVLEYLAAGMTQEQILADFPDITAEDIRAVLAFAAERERRLFSMP